MTDVGREHVSDRGSEADIESAQTLTADVFCPSQIASPFYDVVQLRTVLVVTPAASGVPFIGADRDEDWRRYVTVEIRAHASLTGERLEGVILDFGLGEDGRRSIRQRAAVAPYLIDEPGDQTTDLASGFASPVSVRILA